MTEGPERSATFAAKAHGAFRFELAHGQIDPLCQLAGRKMSAQIHSPANLAQNDLFSGLNHLRRDLVTRFKHS